MSLRPKKIKWECPGDIYNHISIAVLYTKSKKTAQCPRADKSKRKCGVYIPWKVFQHFKMKAILSLAAPRMKLEDVGKSEIRRSKGTNTAQSICLMYLKENSEKQRVEGCFQELGGGWQRECLFNGYKVFVAGWKSSRDKLKNTVHWINRPDCTIQSLRGKAGLNFIYALRFFLSQIPLDPSVACGYHQGSLQKEGASPVLGALIEGGRFILRLLIGKSLNEGNGGVMNHDQTKCYKTY